MIIAMIINITVPIISVITIEIRVNLGHIVDL